MIEGLEIFQKSVFAVANSSIVFENIQNFENASPRNR